MTAQQTEPATVQPEQIQLSIEQIGSHGAHWQALCPNAAETVPRWLQDAVDQASLPRGLLAIDQPLPTDNWLLQAAHPHIQIQQIIAVEGEQPMRLCSAFPSVHSPYWQDILIQRISVCAETLEAVLQVETLGGTRIYGFDTLYAVNAGQYQSGQAYRASFGGLAYQLEKVGAQETLTVDDPTAIRHHRALNQILAQHNGIAPADLQAQIDAWQPSGADDEAPVHLDLSKMAAYLFGEQLGQEDEAWFQGEILGAQQTQLHEQLIHLYDVAILKEEQVLPLVVRIACADFALDTKTLQVGDYIRGNIWLQMTIHAMSTPSAP